MDAQEFNSILERVRKSNDETAFKKIQDEYTKKIKAVAFHVLNRVDFADDVLQEVLIKIWNHGRSVANPNSWVGKIATNAAYDYYRNYLTKWENLIPLDFVARSSAAAKSENDTYSRVIFDSMLNGLDKTAKEIVVRRVLFSYTFEEIVADLKMPRTVVYEHYEKAKEKLRNNYFKK